MFDIEFSDTGEVIMRGRLDASQAPRALEFLEVISEACVVDMRELEYISSAGLGALLKTHKRLMAGAGGLKIINVNHHINDIFRYSGFDRLFEITPLSR